MSKAPKKPVDPALERARRMRVVRITGFSLILLGLVVMGGWIALPRILGLLFVLMGLFDLAVFPAVLRRKWERMQ
ncbi:MAG TPA: hypothetical protein VN222_18705 [Novosphingobium sp.]|nr:hypothetical protein [Novosphingobium sp.]